MYTSTFLESKATSENVPVIFPFCVEQLIFLYLSFDSTLKNNVEACFKNPTSFLTSLVILYVQAISFCFF